MSFIDQLHYAYSGAIQETHTSVEYIQLFVRTLFSQTYKASLA